MLRRPFRPARRPADMPAKLRWVRRWKSISLVVCILCALASIGLGFLLFKGGTTGNEVAGAIGGAFNLYFIYRVLDCLEAAMVKE